MDRHSSQRHRRSSERGGERLALTRGHLRELVAQHDVAGDQLCVVVGKTELATRGLAHQRKTGCAAVVLEAR
jgi:hypothetical protein